jgi:hypothetical protein
VLYDVSTLYFETDAADGVPRTGILQGTPPGSADHDRAADRPGRVPADGEAFEKNKAETLTMLPTIRSFMHAHQLADVTIVADAGMISAANQRAIEQPDHVDVLRQREVGGVPCKARRAGGS